MPPKRKAAATKAVAPAETVENGAESTEAPKAKRGRATKQPEKVESVVERKPRSTRNKAAAPAVEEKQVTEEEKKTQKKDEGDQEPTMTKAKTTRKKKTDNPDSTSEPKTTKSRKAPEERGEPLQNQTDTNYNNLDFSCNKQNAQGNLPNLKISSWNVDGIRAWLKKNGQEYVVHEKPDIFCLQETKCSEEKIPDELNKFLDYYSYWCCSEKEGYAGVALFSKLDPLSVKYGIDNEEFDEEGRCITAEYEKFYVVNVYVPNAGRKLVTLTKRLEWNTLFNEFIDKLDEKKPVIVCGDMNVAHNEIDLTNPKANKRNAGFTIEERNGFTEFLGEQYIDSFRSLYPEQENAYTFWSYMMKARAKDIGWRLDYFIVSKRLLDNVCDNVIRSKVFGSDHCPITLFLNI